MPGKNLILRPVCVDPVDEQKSEFSCHPVIAGPELSIQDKTAADTGTECDHRQRLRALSSPQGVLSQGSAVGIVFQCQRQIAFFSGPGPQVQSVEPFDHIPAVNDSVAVVGKSRG